MPHAGPAVLVHPAVPASILAGTALTSDGDLGVHLLNHTGESFLHLTTAHLEGRGEQSVVGGELVPQHAQIPNLLLVGQFGTQLGHPLADLLGQFRAAQFLVGRQARDVQALGQLLDLRQGRFDEQGEAGAIVAQDDGLFEERVLEQFGLDRLGSCLLYTSDAADE